MKKYQENLGQVITEMKLSQTSERKGIVKHPLSFCINL